MPIYAGNELALKLVRPKYLLSCVEYDCVQFEGALKHKHNYLQDERILEINVPFY